MPHSRAYVGGTLSYAGAPPFGLSGLGHFSGWYESLAVRRLPPFARYNAKSPPIQEPEIRPHRSRNWEHKPSQNPVAKLGLLQANFATGNVE